MWAAIGHPFLCSLWEALIHRRIEASPLFKKREAMRHVRIKKMY